MLFNYRMDEDRAKDFKAPTKTGLKPLEAELQRIEQLASHVVAESDHQREREVAHRNTSGTYLVYRSHHLPPTHIKSMTPANAQSIA